MYSFYESIRSKKFGRTSTNMYLQYKWDTENFANHRYNVKTAKPSIDNSAPQTFTHMFVRPKKLQLELERYSTIQRNNRFLLERLAKIEREGAWIDNKNYSQSRSLNTWKRQQEMIHLAHNNQIMIARLQDVKAQHNRTKLEDEYLINQKYKANIQKWPPNWREVQKHLNRVKADIFKKVFDSKYQTEAYRKSRKLALRKWALEREKHAAAKAEKIAQENIEREKREQIEKERRKMEKDLKSSDKLKSERDKRLEKPEESKKRELKKAEKIKRETQDRQIKQRQKRKEGTEEQRKTKEKEIKKQEKLEEEKKANDKFKTKLRRNKTKQSTEDENIKIKPIAEEKESRVSNVKTTGAEEILATDSTIKKPISDEILSRELTVSDRKALESKETEEVLSGEEFPKSEQTASDEEAQTAQQTTSDYKNLTVGESVVGHESSIKKQIGPGEEAPTERTTSNQDVSDGEREQTDSEEETLTTESNVSDEESS